MKELVARCRIPVSAEDGAAPTPEASRRRSAGKVALNELFGGRLGTRGALRRQRRSAPAAPAAASILACRSLLLVLLAAPPVTARPSVTGWDEHQPRRRVRRLHTTCDTGSEPRADSAGAPRVAAGGACMHADVRARRAHLASLRLIPPGNVCLASEGDGCGLPAGHPLSAVDRPGT
eukprot:363302-Chlamydomonas_euryale.AAC.17